MALARETLSGPFPFRGLHDFPERADYGNAALARNVDFGDGWMRPRLATDRIGRIVESSGIHGLNDLVNSVELVRYHEDEGASLLVAIGRHYVDPSELRLVIDSPGNVVAAPYRSQVYTGCDSRRPTSCEWNVTIPRKLIVFLPFGNISPASSVPVLVSSQFPYIEPLVPSGVSGGTADEGAYLGPNDQVLGDWAVVHQSRLFVGDSSGRLRYSSTGDMYAWPTANEINEFGGEPLTGAASYNGSLIVFTRNAGYVVDFDGQQSYKVKPLLHSTGCVHYNTIIEAARQLIWLADDGLVGLDASGNVSEISKNIQRTIRAFQGDFVNASLIHYAARRQLWLLLPTSRSIFVLDLRTGDWSTHDWGVNEVYPGSLCLVPMANIYRPAAGIRLLDDAGDRRGQIVVFEQPIQGDWNKPGGTRTTVEASWQSLPIMSLGHHTPRVFRHWRVVARDTGNLDTNSFYWLTQGQAGSSTPEVAGQSVTGYVIAPNITRRWNDGVAWWNTAGAYWPNSTGVLDTALRFSLGGIHTGRWIQLGVRKTSSAGSFNLRSFELDTRRFEGRR